MDNYQAALQFEQVACRRESGNADDKDAEISVEHRITSYATTE